jgi:general secretion pathway protein G
MQRIRTRRARRSAFTLLEILIVVGILALLAAFVVPSLIRSGDEAKKELARAAVGRNGRIADALKKYKLYSGTYPETDDGLEALYKRPSHIDEDSEKWRGPYLEGNPEELLDPWQNQFVYECPGKFNEDSYDLSSPGPDGKEDTEDDIKNWTER